MPDAHNGIINAIDTVGSRLDCGAAEVVTGGKDGFVKVWDPRQANQPAVQIESISTVDFPIQFSIENSMKNI